MEVLGLWNYWVVIVLMMIGLYIVIARDNLVKKVMGLNIFQVSVIMFYVSLGKVHGGTAPILPEDEMHELANVEYSSSGHISDTRHAHDEHADAHGEEHAPTPHHGDGHQVVAEGHEGILYSNPLPHVLMLTAIVVGVATTAVGLSLIVRIHEAYGTAEEDEIVRMDAAGVQ